MPSFCNLYLQQYSLLYIQTLLNGCSHIEDVHFLFCANIFFFSLFWQLLNLDIFKQFSNFVLWLFTQWSCTPHIYAHLILYFWVFNLEIVKSPTVDYIVKFGCNLISFLYIWTLHMDCSHTDMHRRRRSRAEFGLVYFRTLYICTRIDQISVIIASVTSEGSGESTQRSLLVYKKYG